MEGIVLLSFIYLLLFLPNHEVKKRCIKYPVTGAPNEKKYVLMIRYVLFVINMTSKNGEKINELAI